MNIFRILRIFASASLFEYLYEHHRFSPLALVLIWLPAAIGLFVILRWLWRLVF